MVGYQPADQFSGHVGKRRRGDRADRSPDAAQFSVPSKVLSYMSAGRAIIGLMPSGNPAAADVHTAGGFVATPTVAGANAAADWLAAITSDPRALPDRRGRPDARRMPFRDWPDRPFIRGRHSARCRHSKPEGALSAFVGVGSPDLWINRELRQREPVSRLELALPAVAPTHCVDLAASRSAVATNACASISFDAENWSWGLDAAFILRALGWLSPPRHFLMNLRQ